MSAERKLDVSTVKRRDYMIGNDYFNDYGNDSILFLLLKIIIRL